MKTKKRGAYKNSYTNLIRQIFKQHRRLTLTELKEHLKVTKEDKKALKRISSAIDRMLKEKELKKIERATYLYVEVQVVSKKVAAWNYIKAAKKVSIEDLMQITNMTRKDATGYLEALKSQDLLRKVNDVTYRLISETDNTIKKQDTFLKTKALLKQVEQAKNYLTQIELSLQALQV